MASFSAGTTFTDGVANDVTAAKLGALVNNATPLSGLIQDRTAETITATNDTLLIGDASDSNALKRITVANFAQTLPTAKITTGTIETGTFGTTTSTAATITTGTITTGVIPTLTSGTTTSTAATITTGTIPTLVATTLITSGTGTAAAPAIVPTGDTNTGAFFPAADTVAVSTQGTERLRITSGGDVLVGSDTAILTSGVGVKYLAASNFGTVINASGAFNTYTLFNINATNNGYRFYVGANGGINNFSANNVNLSDERLKTNIEVAGGYLDKICSIPVKTFNYKDQGEDTEKTIGVIAQDVEAIIPELINNDGFGETPSDGIPYKTIYQTDLQYVLMRCIQELKSENDSLKTRIAALEAA